MADPKTVQYSDLESLVGQTLGPSDWFEVDQPRINTFADATGDHQWIHVNEAMAKQMLGSTIAHGYLTLSLIPMFGPQVLRVEGVTRGINYGANKVRFTNMVPVNSKLRMTQTVKEVNEKAGGKQMISECTIEIEGQERPACVAETITILYG
ncbi:MAG: MaoC family dehydratase [Hyphomonadaceae bacterium]|nr:MaoC family dehydratase [Hyphomonadaceae bacterium]